MKATFSNTMATAANSSPESFCKATPVVSSSRSPSTAAGTAVASRSGQQSRPSSALSYWKELQSSSRPAAVQYGLPFHEGERQMQEEALSQREQEEVHGFAPHVIREFMPDQHRQFYSQLNKMYIGYEDMDGNPVGTVLGGRRGFVSSPDPTHLLIDLHLVDRSLRISPGVGQRIGMIGIELHTRRRNRVNGTVTQSDESVVLIEVDQSFGNCPKYINRRTVELSEDGLPEARGDVEATSGWGPLHSEHINQVRAADTFFVSSMYGGSATRKLLVGADMSHRGGAPGFVRVSSKGDELLWPDYRGNNMFQTLGNFLTNPKCGLLFVDYPSGDILQISGVAEVLCTDSGMPGAQRTVRVKVCGWRHLKAGLPVKQHAFLEASPYNPPVLASSSSASQLPGEEVKVVSVTDEAEGIKTFELSAPTTVQRPILPGMHAAFSFPPGTTGLTDPFGSHASIQRTWTVSSYHPGGALPSGSTFTISVKRQPGGLVSEFLHNRVQPGDHVRLLGFSGDFTPSHREPRQSDERNTASPTGPDLPPVVLLAAGIGITPLRPMLLELRQASPSREVTVLLSVRQFSEAAFVDEIASVAAKSNGRVQVVVTATRAQHAAGLDGKGHTPPRGSLRAVPLEGLSRQSVAFAGGFVRSTGRLNASALKALGPSGLAQGQAVVYMCGPTAFMGAMEEQLQAAGADMKKVHCESFSY